VNFVHKTNYTSHATFCKCFFGENFTDAVPSIVEGSIILTTFFLGFTINIWGLAIALLFRTGYCSSAEGGETV